MRWVLIFWVFLMSAISYLDRVNISIAGSAVQKDFGLTTVQLGYVFSAFVWAYALFQAPAGRLADKFGPRLVVTLGVLWWSVFTAATALVPAGAGAMSLAMLIGVRFILGAGEAVVYPASNRLVAKWIPTNERGIANGLIFAGVGAGAGVTPPLITYVLMNYGWHMSFYVCAAIGAAAAVGWHFLARDVPQGHPFVSQKELAHIEAGIPAVVPGKVVKIVPWGKILACKDIWFMTVSYFAYGYSAWIFFTWFFRYLNDVRGLDLKASAFYSMLPFMAMAACSPLGGWIADALTKKFSARVGRCGIGVVGMGGAAVFIALATQVESAKLASLVLACGIGMQYLSQSCYWAVTADVAGSSAGSVSGFMNMGGQIGGAITAILTPMIAESFGWTASFMTAAALCAMGSILWLLVNPGVRLEKE
jgi:ACS family glucarate transporter-like MFS transporter